MTTPTAGHVRPDARPTSGSPAALGLWPALAIGEVGWIDGDEPPAARERAVAAVLVLALVFLGLHLWGVLPQRLHDAAHPNLLWGSAIVGSACALMLAHRPMNIVLGRPRWPGIPAVRTVWRTLAALVVVASSVALQPGWGAIGAWPIGVAAGADVVLTGWALGLRLRPIDWWVRVTTSPMHLGIVGALVAVTIRQADSEFARALVGLYVAWQLWVAASVVTVLLLLKVGQAIEDERGEAASQVLAAEHRRLAHWIHDDVCADLQLTAMRLRTGRIAGAQVEHELTELEHRLRLRQQREVIDSGQARLAELLQPYVRRVQGAGVRLTEVPTLDDASIRVDTELADRFARSVSVLTSNALNAGATEIGVRVRHDDDTVTVTVTDDAGGFTLDEVPAGRGLDSLRADGVHLAVTPTDRGSQVTADIARSKRPPVRARAAR
jgi:signal transduction histidine kinase